VSGVARNRRIWRARLFAALAAALCLSSAGAATGASPGADADAATLEACRSEPSMSGRDPRECGERLFRQCLAEAGDAGRQPAGMLACEKRRAEAWNALGRQAYRRIEAKLGDADRRLLRTSQVQFELELRDLCAATRMLNGGDPDLVQASCASDLIAARALVLARLAGGGTP
jgi:hypothetical protein